MKHHPSCRETDTELVWHCNQCGNIEQAEHGIIKNVVQRCLGDWTAPTLALGWLRYEALRKVSPAEYLALHNRNIAGEPFDGMVDKLISEAK